VSNDNYENVPGEYIGTYLYLPPGAIDISGYNWAVNPQDEYQKGEGYTTVVGDRGTYQIYWTTLNTGIPSLKILLDGKMILEQDLNSYIDDISKKYPPGNAGNVAANSEDMCLLLEAPEADILLVFSYIQISVDTTNDIINYGFDLNGLYVKENP
jgi:hypothetical protein